MREAQLQVLAGEVPHVHQVPRQLPTALPHFVGRAVELERLGAVVGAGRPLVISGSGGGGEGWAGSQRGSRQLDEQVGVGPGAALREAQLQVLAGEVPHVHQVPRQLPTALP
ncbi:hypothetical protein ADL03_05660, partial [Nocardia sp. NRRL S-836]